MRTKRNSTSKFNLIDEYVRYIKGQAKLDPNFTEREMKFQGKHNPDMARLLRKYFPLPKQERGR